jgi:release factor glutamine methyltransferase
MLRAAGIEAPRLEAELLLSGVMGISRSMLRLERDLALDESVAASFRNAVARRSQREPTQYILGRASFRTLELHVDARVLIPRPETELLVGAVLDWAGRRGRWGAVADIGTGSGAISLSLAAEGRFSHVIGTDVSHDALGVARENAVRLGLEERIEFRAGSLWSALLAGTRFDAIVSNPPYVAQHERPHLMPEVADWEPAVALYAEDEGLRVLNALLDGAQEWLEPGGLLALEIGFGQGEAVRARARQMNYEEIRILRDLAGRERIILAERGRTVVRGTTG